jgi:plastocyanin
VRPPSRPGRRGKRPGWRGLQRARHVTKLKAGTRYRFVINDRASIHDFHLVGPGLNRVLTTVDFTGTRSLLLTLRKGVYRYLCDPHASFMKGTFKVT